MARAAGDYRIAAGSDRFLCPLRLCLSSLVWAANSSVWCSIALSAETIVIRNVDVYPVIGAEMKGVSVVLQDGKIAEIGAKIVPAKGARIIEGKGLRVYPGMIDSATELGLSVQRGFSFPFPRAFGRAFVYNECVLVAST